MRIQRPENVEDAKVSGIEFQLIQNELDFLPGPLSNLGFNLNYSYFDGELNVDQNQTIGRLLEQPDSIINLALFYAGDNYEGRISYNKTGEQLKLNQRLGVNQQFDDAREFLDMQFRYDLSDKVQLLFEGRNLSNEPEQTRFVQSPGFVADSSTFGRSFWLGFSYTIE